jgi:hypothetical protein
MLLDPPLRLLQKGTINFASQNCFITNAALLAQYLEGAELDGNASGSLRAYAANEFLEAGTQEAAKAYWRLTV